MSNVLLLRLDDHASNSLIRPKDAVGNLADMAALGAASPIVVEAATGYGRFFASNLLTGFIAQDAVPGATLLTRDLSIQAILAWDLEAAATYGVPQCIYARGRGTSTPEYISVGLELRVVNAAAKIGELRFLWQDLAGNLKTQIGGHFQVPDTGYLMLTATRRWVSSSRVVLRYYLGDALLAEIESVDGSIAGGTLGSTTIGARGATSWFFDGVIDELRVVDEELSPEEIAMTWRRMTVEQPNGYRLYRDAHDPGFPISQNPDSRAQRETRLLGNGLGFAAAQGENIRANILPDRAYGRVLERWEAITKQPSTTADDTDTRRARVTGKIKQKRGASIPGIGDALSELLDAEPSQLAYIAYDQTVRNTWDTLNDAEWRKDPVAQWTINAAALRVIVPSGALYAGVRDWSTARMPIGGNGRAASMLVKMSPTALADNVEVGIAYIDRVKRNAVMIGLRNVGGTKIIYETNIVGDVVSSELALSGGLGYQPFWLSLDRGPTGITYPGFSIVGPTSGFIYDEIGTDDLEYQWACFYVRTYAGATAGSVGATATFDDSAVRAPYGTRSHHAYVYRDPSIPGSPDFLGANAVLKGLKQAHTHMAAGPSRFVKYDDSSTPMDGLPMGE